MLRAQITVTKRDGDKEFFDISKLERSLAVALKNRNVTPARIRRVAFAIAEVFDQGDALRGPRENAPRLATTAQIGHLAMESLKALDLIGYVRYTSVHKRFYSLEQFEKLLDAIDYEIVDEAQKAITSDQKPVAASLPPQASDAKD